MLYYVMLTQEQTDELNSFLIAYCTPPTTTYVPVGLFPFLDNDSRPQNFYDSRNDLQFTQEQRDYVQAIIDTKKTYAEAVAAGWIIEPNDG